MVEHGIHMASEKATVSADRIINPFVTDVANSFLSKTTIIFVSSGEWKRIEGGILDAIDAEVEGTDLDKRYFFRYGNVSKFEMWKDEGQDEGHWTNDDDLISRFSDDNYDEILSTIRDGLDLPLVLWLDDFHPVMNSDREAYPDSMWLLRHFARVHENGGENSTRKTIIISGENVPLLEELQHESSVVELPLPTYPVLKRAMEIVQEEFNIPSEKVDYTEDFVGTALGLSIEQALRAYRKAFILHGDLCSEKARREVIKNKRMIISQSGCLAYIEPDVDISDIGGLEILKQWLEVRRKAYSQEARDRGLPLPKGLLLTGVPGCGKSLTAKAVASNWGYPLIRFDIAAAFGGIVGESESNIRQALRVAEAASPCVLWIDEIEKGLAGSGGSGDLDSGTTQRVFGTILTWLNEVSKPVFVVATANNLANLPPELKRKGRFDEIFFVDLPEHQSRKEILHLHIKNREPGVLDSIDLDALASKSDGFTGAELENVVKDAQFFAFNDGNRPLTQNDIMEEIVRLNPMSESMKTDIDAMRLEANKIGQKASKDSKSGKPPRKQTSSASYRGM